jgi:hypothetical protein
MSSSITFDGGSLAPDAPEVLGADLKRSENANRRAKPGGRLSRKMCWLKQIRLALNQHVMPANAGIHVLREPQRSKTWMAGT